MEETQTNTPPDAGTPEDETAGTKSNPITPPDDGNALEEKSVFSDNAENTETSWTDSLPEELKGNPHLKRFKSQNDVIKSYVGLCSMAGKKGLMPPPEGATQAEIEAYLSTRRGGVESADAYSIKYEMVKNYGLTEEAYKGLCNDLFNAGLSDREHGNVMRAFANLRNIEKRAWVEENNTNCERALIEAKHHWGMDYEAKLSGVKQLMNAFPEAKKILTQAGAQNHFHVLDMLSRFAEIASEGGAPKDNGSAPDAKTLDAELEKLVASAAYNDPSSPGHQAAMSQFWKLMDKKASVRS